MFLDTEVISIMEIFNPQSLGNFPLYSILAQSAPDWKNAIGSVKLFVSPRNTGWKPSSPLAAASRAAVSQVAEGGTTNKQKRALVFLGAGNVDQFVPSELDFTPGCV